MSSRVDDHHLDRERFFKVMLMYSKERKKLRYIPYKNVAKKNPFGLSAFFTRFARFTNRNNMVINAGQCFVRWIFKLSHFRRDEELFFFFVIFKDRVEAYKYAFSEEQFLLRESLLFSFSSELAPECFSCIIDTYSEKLEEGEIEELLNSINNKGIKIEMFFQKKVEVSIITPKREMRSCIFDKSENIE